MSANRVTLGKYLEELGLSFNIGETNTRLEARIHAAGSRTSEEGMSDGLVGFLKRDKG